MRVCVEKNTFKFVTLMTMVWTCVRPSQLPIEVTTEVTAGVLQRYQSAAVCVLRQTQDQGFQTDTRLAKFLKFLSKHYITVSAFQSSQWTMEDNKYLPLMVWFYRESKNAQQLLMEVSSTSRGKWLLFYNSVTPLNEFFRNIHIPLDSEVLVVQWLSHSHVWITEAYHIHHTLPLQMNWLGNWSSDGGLTWTNISHVHRRSELHGIVIKSGFINFSNVLYATKFKRRKPIEIRGFSYEIWNALQNKINFTNDYYMPEDKVFGSLENGRWSGLIKMLVTEQVDVVILTVMKTPNRMLAADFFTPLIRTKFSIYIKKPATEEYTLNHLLKPLSMSLWWTIFVAMISTMIVLTALWQVSKNQEADTYNLYSSAFYVFGIFCQTGLDPVPQTWACRLVILTTFLTALFVSVAYSATFISILTVNRYKLPFTDIKGFSENGKYVLSMLPNSAQLSIFQTSSDPILRDVYNRLMVPSTTLPMTNEEGLSTVCQKSNYAYLTLSVIEKLIRPHLSCSTVEVPDYSIPVSMSMVGRKQNAFKTIFNYYFVTMHEAGIVKRNEENLLPLKFKQQTEELPKSVSLKKTMPIFIVLVVGVLMAMLFLLLEILIYKIKQKNCFSKNTSPLPTSNHI